MVNLVAIRQRVKETTQYKISNYPQNITCRV